MRWTSEQILTATRLFDALVDVPPDQRAAILDRECGRDAELRRRVERMLREDTEPDSILDRGAWTVADPNLGLPVGAYRLVERIGEGGMGMVYRASRHDGAFDLDVAVKLLPGAATSGAVRERLERERRTLARLREPGIARLLDGGTTGQGVPYLVMELVKGEAIDHYCRRLCLSLPSRLRCFIEVCRAVHAAHRSLVVHGDLKPGNILVDDQGRPHLVDFGVAMLLIDDGVLADGAFTPEYASPEQIRGEPIGVASDVWSLGVVLHELCTGARPALDSQPGGSPSTPRRPIRRLSGDLDAIVARALSADPSRRYASVWELAEDLQRHLDRLPVRARARTAGYVAARFAERHAIVLALAAAAFVSLAGGMIGTARQRDRAQQEAAHSRAEATSSHWITEFLTETFLNSEFIPDEAARARACVAIEARASRVRRQFRDDPHVGANLIDALGAAALSVGLMEDAERLTREALSLRLSTFGALHIETALSWNSVGRVLYQRGDVQEARQCFERSLAIQEAQPPGPHRDVAGAMNNLAAAAAALGDHRRALELSRNALAIRRAIDARSLEVAESLNNMGNHLAKDGQVDACREALAESWAIRTELLGEDARLTLQTRGNLGIFEFAQGNLDAAHTHLAAMVDGARRLGASGEELLAMGLPRLAMVEADRDPARALAMISEAEPMVARWFGESHPRRAEVMAVYSAVLGKLGRHGESVAAARRVVEILESALPPDHPSVVRAIGNLGGALQDAGEFADAERVLTEAARRERSSRPTSSRLAQLEEGLATIADRDHRPEDRDRHLDAAILLLEQQPDPPRERIEALRRRRE